jgi:hypothetical protein
VDNVPFELQIEPASAQRRGSITIYATDSYRYLETDLFAGALLIQSLPFLAAVALVWLERLSDREQPKAFAPVALSN